MWKARSIFISSTFIDMQAERDYLRTRVFPALEERLRARRYYLEWVDLRVGVATASQNDANARELHVLKVCLAEVKRCRPFLIVLLGDRYGWAPPEDRIKAAAAEEGFASDIIGRSITDLEIDFGVLSDPEQQPRSFFYFRDALPYRDMPPDIAALFSSEHELDSSAADRARRLRALKQRIETLLPTRVRRYGAVWDAENNCVTGFEIFGRMVLEDVWSELEIETRAVAASGVVSWQETERDALDDFAHDKARDFVGREAIIARLISCCLSLAQEGAAWGICIAGDPGAGKSALFAELCRLSEPAAEQPLRRLRGQQIFLLAHAASASIQSSSVDSMLRRWIEELAAGLNVAEVDLTETSDPETVEAVFNRLLHQMAAQQRVVVLIDALDQFETTTRARYLTWLPRPWPTNARLIATAIPGNASSALTQRAGVAPLPLPLLDAGEARAIIQGICGRYHRSFEPDATSALLNKVGPYGPAWGNPLWLVLAVEELNLLDADDFDRARTYPGRPDEQLRAMMLEHIAMFPGDIPGLYRHTFDHAERLFGGSAVRNFLGLIAVSRAGWRENDFRILLPRASGENWDPLRFAELRRAFRGQMRRSGSIGSWDFSHAQMRAAVRARLPTKSIPEQRLHTQQDLHTIIADRLLSCPSDDPLHITETMVHLLGSEDWTRAARYYGEWNLSKSEVEGATKALAAAILTSSSGKPTDAVSDLCRLLDAPDVDDGGRTLLGVRFLFELSDAVEAHATLETRVVILRHVKLLFERLTSGGGSKRDRVWQRYLSVSHLKIGDIQVSQGDLKEAQTSFQTSLSLVEALADTDPNNSELQRDLAVSFEKLGTVHMVLGASAEALRCYHNSLAYMERLARDAPDNANAQHSLAIALTLAATTNVAQGNLQEALRLSCKSLAIDERLINLDPRHLIWRRDLASTYRTVGDLEMALGHPADALQAYRSSLAIAETLANTDPSNTNWQRDLLICHSKIADLHAAQRSLTEALQSYRQCLAINERLAGTDPANTDWQHDLSVSFAKIGKAELSLGKLMEALQSYRASLAVLERLGQLDPANSNWQRDSSFCYINIGDIEAALGNIAGAKKCYQNSLDIFERLAAAGPDDADSKRNLAVVYERFAQVLRDAGDTEGALGLFWQSKTIVNRMLEHSPDNAQLKGDLRWVEEQIKQLGGDPEDSALAEQSRRREKEHEAGRLLQTAQSYEGKGEFIQAMQVLKKAQDLLMHVGKTEAAIRTMVNRERLYALHLGMPSAALPGLQRAEQLASQHGLSGLADSIKEISDKLRKSNL